MYGQLRIYDSWTHWCPNPACAWHTGNHSSTIARRHKSPPKSEPKVGYESRHFRYQILQHAYPSCPRRWRICGRLMSWKTCWCDAEDQRLLGSVDNNVIRQPAHAQYSTLHSTDMKHYKWLWKNNTRTPRTRAWRWVPINSANHLRFVRCWDYST